jgi:hypothetical protein
VQISRCVNSLLEICFRGDGCLLFRLARCLVLVDVIAIWTNLVLLIDTGKAVMQPVGTIVLLKRDER